MASLRALATVDAEQGGWREAIAFDQEALGLAIAPSAIERIRIQMAVHTAATGHLEEAKAQLDGVLSKGARSDQIIRSEALLQRAVLLRKLGRSREALADLAAARPRLHALSNAREEFES